MPAGLLLTVPPPPPAAWTTSWTEPVGKLELLAPPPQPQRMIRKVALRQKMTARYFKPDPDIRWHALSSTTSAILDGNGARRVALLRKGSGGLRCVLPTR